MSGNGSGETGLTIPQMPVAGVLTGNELLYLVQNNQDVRSTVSNLSTFLPAIYLPLTGGTLTGNLTLASSFTQNDSVGWAMSNGPWLSSLVNAKGPSLTGQFDAMSFTIQDDTHVSSGGLVGLNIAMNVAPNGNTASGGKIAFSATLDEIGTSQGGTITASGIASGGVINAWSSSNTGGTSSNYIGALNGLNCTMELKSGATFKDGGTGLEVDTTAATGSSYDAIEQVLISTLPNHAIAGRLNANAGILFTGASGAIADTMDMIRVGGQGSAYPGHPFGRIFYAGATQGYTLTSQVSASAFDVANNTSNHSRSARHSSKTWCCKHPVSPARHD